MFQTILLSTSFILKLIVKLERLADLITKLSLVVDKLNDRNVSNGKRFRRNLKMVVSEYVLILYLTCRDLPVLVTGFV